MSHLPPSPFSGRAGVPMEVMGLMLGEFVDEYTVRVIDVFAMPQSGTVSIYNTSILKIMYACRSSIIYRTHCGCKLLAGFYVCVCV